MRTGKLPEHTFKRSVIHALRFRGEQTTFRTAVGHDGAVFGNVVTAIASTAFYYAGNERYALDNAINNVIAAGGKPYGVSVAVLLPEHSEEATLRQIMDRLAKTCEEYQIDLMAGHTELVPSVVSPTVTVTAYGHVLWENRHEQVTAGMDIVMTKWTGLYGGAVLAGLKKEELMTRYPASYVETAGEYMQYTSLLPEEKALELLSRDCGIYAAHDVSFGGVFGALWQILEACHCGTEIGIEQIPVKQEIIEVSEYFNMNPYMMNGQGSLLLIVQDGDALVAHLKQQGVFAVVLGKTTKEQKRIIRIGEEERFLVPPKGDALNAVFYGQPVPV